MVDRYAKVIGINTLIYGKKLEGVLVGETIKFAIPINIAKELLPQLLSGRNVITESREVKKEKECSVKSEKYYNELVELVNQTIDYVWNVNVDGTLLSPEIQELIKPDREKSRRLELEKAKIQKEDYHSKCLKE